MLSCNNQFRIGSSQQDVFQHGWVGQYDMRRVVANILTGIDHVGIFRVLQLVMSLTVRIILYPFIFASCHMLNTAAHFLCIIRLVCILGFHFWQVTIIYSIGQASAGSRFCNRQKFFQTLLLVFHQSVERIEKKSLYLIWQCILWEVMNQWHHKALRLTRTSTRSHDNRFWLIVCRSLSE